VRRGDAAEYESEESYYSGSYNSEEYANEEYYED